MSIAFEAFLPLVLPDVPGCPQALAMAALRRGAGQLCRSAYVWTETVGPLDVVAGQAEYVCPPPADAAVVITLGANLAGLPLRAVSAEELDARHPGWTGLTAARPMRFLVPMPGTVRLVPEPSQDMPAALAVRLVLAPTHDGPSVPDHIHRDHAAAVAHAAKAELMLVPGKPWTQPQLAEHHARQFAAHVSRARGRVTTGWTGETLTVPPRSFGG